MKILLMSPWFDWYASDLKERIPGLLATPNYEEVLGLVRSGEVEALCIVSGGYNYSKEACNTIRGESAATELHKINPDIPILIWEGKNSSETINRKNETYVSASDYDYNKGRTYKVTEDFFNDS
jgi:hypothetical protein